MREIRTSGLTRGAGLWPVPTLPNARLRTPRPRPLAALRNTTCPQRGHATLPGERAARLASSRVRGLSLVPSRIIQASLWESAGGPARCEEVAAWHGDSGGNLRWKRSRGGGYARRAQASLPGLQPHPRQESPRQESPRQESPRQESPRQESPRQESPRHEYHEEQPGGAF